jgi:hypothetical protein
MVEGEFMSETLLTTDLAPVQRSNGTAEREPRQEHRERGRGHKRLSRQSLQDEAHLDQEANETDEQSVAARHNAVAHKIDSFA